MEAKDTVMSRNEKKMLIVARSHQQTVGESQEDMLLNAQAEISFKAGMVEVTKYVEANYHPANVSHIHIVKNEWHRKLKEWGIE